MFSVILLIGMFTFIGNLNPANAYDNKEVNSDRTNWPMFHGNSAHTGYSSAINVPKTNNTLWMVNCSGETLWQPAIIADGVVYIGSEESHVYALNASTGALLWKATVLDAVCSAPSLQDGVLYIGLLRGIQALNASTGSVLWTFMSPRSL